ncbi:MAG: methanogenesis marker 17 protein [Methanomicrobiales archaeon]|nr:methanogenesis marker 17 protein [Methanomicrobiales archaeon]
MKAFEYFEVECPEPVGGAAYRAIAEHILQDLDLLKVIGRLHIYIDPKVPIFVAVGLTRKLPRLVRVRDLSNVLERPGNIVLDIADETHLSELLTVLWDRYGRDRIDQPDRFTVVINDPEAKGAEIEDIVVFDPSEYLYRDLIYALQYIAPEGFKVRREWVREGRFFYVASENTLPEDVVDRLVAAQFAKIGVKE